MLGQFWRWLRRLWDGLRGVRRQAPPPKRLSDAECENLFLQLLELAAAGGTAQEMAEFLDRHEAQMRQVGRWFGRWQRARLADAVPNRELAWRLVKLGQVECGELGERAAELGRQILARPGVNVPPPSRRTEAKKAPQSPPPPPSPPPQPQPEPVRKGERSASEDNSVLAALLNQSAEQYQAGDYEGMLATCDRALALQPDFYIAWTNRGLALQALERYEEALASHDRALALQPDFYQAWYNRGNALQALERYEEAVASHDRALALQPDYYQAWYNRGNALEALERYEEAVASYDRALALQPDFYIAWSNRGNALEALERYEEALASHDRALALQPDFYIAWSNRGNALEALERNEEALASYDRALALQPDLYQAWSNRGNALEALERNEEALASYDRALALQPDFYIAWSNRGSAAGKSGYCETPVARSLPPEMQNPDLDRRGYEGKIASYREGLKYVPPETEGWGILHYESGHAHFIQGKTLQRWGRDSLPLWQQAVDRYQTALTVLTRDAFPKPHLKVLQDYLRVALALEDLDTAARLRIQGVEAYNHLLNTNRNPSLRAKLEAQFLPFSHLGVELLLRQGQLVLALETADRLKNRTLTWILDAWQETVLSPQYADIQRLLAPTTAAVYWHLAPDTLITFILKADAPQPIALIRDSTPLEQFLENWNRTYANYTKLKADSDPESPWREQLPNAIEQRLPEILDLPAILPHLADATHLLLFPHRDLHRLPLPVLFPHHIATVLPSAQIALNLSDSRKDPPNCELRTANCELLILSEPPHQGLESLGTTTELETAIAAHYYPNPTVIESNSATADVLQTYLAQPHDIFLFSGHAAYNSRNPADSALFLAGQDKLTAKAIAQLDLSPYQLIVLAACETAIAGQQTLDIDFVGLASSCLKAGAASVLSTLWTVESRASAWFIARFLQHLHSGTPSDRAFRQTQTWLQTLTNAELADWLSEIAETQERSLPTNLHQILLDNIKTARADPDEIPYANPYFWASFVLSSLPLSASQPPNSQRPS